jgi:4,5-DOPA dioxygenase extradiol
MSILSSTIERSIRRGVRAHPTDEHFLPLFVALGSAPEKYKAERLYDGIEMGSLAMDAYRFS